MRLLLSVVWICDLQMQHKPIKMHRRSQIYQDESQILSIEVASALRISKRKYVFILFEILPHKKTEYLNFSQIFFVFSSVQKYVCLHRRDIILEVRIQTWTGTVPNRPRFELKKLKRHVCALWTLNGCTYSFFHLCNDSHSFHFLFLVTQKSPAEIRCVQIVKHQIKRSDKIETVCANPSRRPPSSKDSRLSDRLIERASI